ncbi:AraC family transcriptional regulator [Inquilinus sp. OTU3971]|uniref:AraC family transcriptional regulator n=1 Tax=Inquilinus sp. OTU3971 TaxID=3043855 RepID=UPI00313BEB55
MLKFQIRPPPRLQPYIDRIWGWETGLGERLDILPVFPGPGGAELFFHYGAPLTELTIGAAKGSVLPHAHVLRLRSRPLVLAQQGGLGFIAFRIRSGMAEHVLGCSVASLPDGQTDLESLWGSSVNLAIEEMADCASHPERIHLLCRFVGSRIATARPGVSLEVAISRLERKQVSIAHIAEGLGISVRHLENCFRAATGCSPARFRRLARLRRSIKTILLKPELTSLTDELDPAYFDQSQQIREFRQFTGFSPGELRKLVPGRAHFYNPSWTGAAMLPDP